MGGRKGERKTDRERDERERDERERERGEREFPPLHAALPCVGRLAAVVGDVTHPW